MPKRLQSSQYSAGALALLLSILLVHCALIERAESKSNYNNNKDNPTSDSSFEQLAATSTAEAMSSKACEDGDLDVKEQQVLVKPLLHFTSSIYGQIRQDKKNAILSPLSIHAALNLLALGAEPQLKTDTELRKALGYSDEELKRSSLVYNKAYKSMIANYKNLTKRSTEASKQVGSDEVFQNSPALEPVIDFYNTLITKRAKPLVREYGNQTREYFHSSVEQIDQGKPETISQVVDKINNWAKEAGFEQAILEANDFSGDFGAMLVSAVRVQGYWFEDFGETDREKVFHNFGLKEKAVKGARLCNSRLRGKFVEFCAPNMSQYGDHQSWMVKSVDESLFKELSELKFRAIQIPLRGELSFTILEPLTSGQGNELAELTKKLLDQNGSKLTKTLGVLGESSTNIEFDYFCMPKFGFESDIDLIEPLKAIGVGSIFNRSTSELKRVLEGDRVYVDRARHQALIDVNKSGIKAAGVTTIRMMALSSLNKSVKYHVHVENPFMFIIRHKQIPLFVGQLVELKQ